MTGRRVEYLPLTAVQAAPRNPKRHADDQIRASIDRFGLGELPLIDERTGRLVAGHGRVDQLAAMCAAGQDPPDGVRVTGAEWQIPVVRGWASRSDAEAEAYLVASNKLTANGGWDDEALTTFLADMDDGLLALTGFTRDELAALTPATPEPGGPADPDDTPDEPADPVTEPGDLWLLGRHRLLCGDATSLDDLGRLLDGLGEPGIVYTDPPYGISIVKSSGKIGSGGTFKGRHVPATKYLPVAGDDTTDVAAVSFRLLTETHPGAKHVWWGGNHYRAAAGLPDSPCWLVWDKRNGATDFADCELAWTNHTGAVRLLRHLWSGMMRASEPGKRVHPTQKPVALAEWAFGVVDPANTRTVVLDTFGGSGSTLIAAHRTGRTAAVCEMERRYVDVICRRYQEHTGDKPVLAATGEPRDFVAD